MGNIHQRGLRNLHVGEKTQFLHRYSQNNSQEWPPPPKEILGKEHPNFQSEQLGSLESQNITLEYIPGIRNTLADTLSRLIEMDENIKLQPEEEVKSLDTSPSRNYHQWQLKW